MVAKINSEMVLASVLCLSRIRQDMLTRLPRALERSSTSLKRRGASFKAKSGPKSFHTSRRSQDSVYTFGDNTACQCAQYEVEMVTSPIKLDSIPPNTSISDVFCSWKSNFIFQRTF